jgi:hypothetical protein
VSTGFIKTPNYIFVHVYTAHHFILSLSFPLMHTILHILQSLLQQLGFKSLVNFHSKTLAKTLFGPLSLLHVSDTSVHTQGVFLDLG